MSGRLKLALAGVAVLAAAAIVGGLFLLKRPDNAPPPSTIAMPADVKLNDQNGRPFTAASLNGKPTAIFFGFTYCPEICPTTLTDMGVRLAAMGKAADDLNVVFVTIDPARDTADQLKTYLSSFDPRVLGVTGPAAEIEKMAKGFRVYYRRIDQEGGEYTMDHSTAIYLLDRKGRFVEPIAYQEPNDSAVRKLKALVAR